MKAILLFLLAFLVLPLQAQTAADSVTISGRVTDYEGHPIDSCSLFWQTPSFDDVVQGMTDADGRYTVRLPRGKYQSMGALRMDTYPHTPKGSTLPAADQRLEFWAWDFIADRDTTLDIRYHRMEVYGLRVFRIPGAMPCYQIFVRPMSLTRFQQMEADKAQHTQDVSNIEQGAARDDARAVRLAPTLDRLKATVWINGEEVPILMKQEIKEYFSADEWGNAYLLTVDRPKQDTALPYHVFKVELEDLDNGDRGEGIYYMEKEQYVTGKDS